MTEKKKKNKHDQIGNFNFFLLTVRFISSLSIRSYFFIHLIIELSHSRQGVKNYLAFRGVVTCSEGL